MTSSRDRSPATGMTYRAAGVDIDAGEALVRRITPAAKSTAIPGVMGGLGGFGALFDLQAAGFVDPILIGATDGVGTKLKVAIEAGIHTTVGIDLVAMCVNDLIVQGGRPLFFLDYFATAKLDVEMAAAVIEGIAQGCRQAGCALIGGETAEMPGFYNAGDYDLAGFAVGAVERRAMLTGEKISAGDVILGLTSNGLHSNGFSLVRQVVARTGLAYDAPAPFTDGPLGAALLAPTRIYVRPLLEPLGTGRIHGLAHITGGGLTGNLPRVVPHGLNARVNTGAWEMPELFRWLQHEGGVAKNEMLHTFNCGIGMAVICPADQAGAVHASLSDAGETVIPLGEIVAGDGVREVIYL